MKSNRTCGNCFFFRGELEVTGICTAPVPASIRFAMGRKLMFSTGGTNCAAHRMRTVRKPVSVAQAVQQ